MPRRVALAAKRVGEVKYSRGLHTNGILINRISVSFSSGAADFILPANLRGGALVRGWRNTVLLLFSIGFYAWGEPLFVFLMLASVLVNWALVIVMDRSAHRKAWLTAAIIFDVLLLSVFKYASFLSENLARLTGNDALIVSIALPIGISFFTFQMMSYVFDVYYGKAAVQKNPLYVALYIALFPQLIAGPIVRYTEVEHDILHRQESFADVSVGVERFIYGLGKKVLLANFLAQIADNVFDSVAEPSVMMAWLGAVAYMFQLYFDFSGYSDMAIGLGRMFGFHFSENFNYPHISKSFTEFWKRWHISLNTWFRDYVYIPLGGNRVSKARWVLNVFIVWTLTGIWHGANWTFLFWGLSCFAILMLEKFTNITRNRAAAIAIVYTLLMRILTCVIFRCASISDGLLFLGRMFGIGSRGVVGRDFIVSIKGTYVIFLASFIGTTPVIAKLFSYLRERGLEWMEHLWLLVVFAVSTLEVVSASYNPFIYFNF